MPSVSNLVAQIPPPAVLKPLPKELVFLSMTVQPVVVAQSASPVEPVIEEAEPVPVHESLV
jgi:hypothetical protein